MRYRVIPLQPDIAAHHWLWDVGVLDTQENTYTPFQIRANAEKCAELWSRSAARNGFLPEHTLWFPAPPSLLFKLDIARALANEGQSAGNCF